MPRNLGTSRKGKPNKYDRESGMGKSLLKLHANKYRPRSDGKNKHGDGGMTMTTGVTSIGTTIDNSNVISATKTKSVLEIQELDDFLLTAELANQQFAVEHEGLVVLDDSASYYHPQGSIMINDHQPRVSFANNDNDNTTNNTTNSINPLSTFAFTELSVPRRPKWDTTTTPEQLEIMERESFLQWRRSVAQQEEKLSLQPSSSTSSNNNNNNQHRIAATPFEKNIQVWRQLWRVLERSDCVVQLVDGRNPLFYLSYDLKQYSTNELNKPMMILINKSDYLSIEQRQLWYDYLTKQHGWDTDAILFFSAINEQHKLDDAAYEERKKQRINNNKEQYDDTDEERDHDTDDDDDDDDDDDSEDEQSDLEKEERRRKKLNLSDLDEKEEEHDDDDHDDSSSKSNVDNANVENLNKGGTDVTQPNETTTTTTTTATDNETTEQISDTVGIQNPLNRTQLLDAMMQFATKRQCVPNPKYDNRIQFGMVGFPNVGKSSVINVLVGSSKHTHGLVRVAVANQPGKTKHFQTLLLPDRLDMMLCDCPGLVFPSFVSNTADLIAAGVYPIAQMRDHWTVMSLICQRIPRPIIEALYGIHLPAPSLDTTYSINTTTTTSSIEQQQHQQQQVQLLPPPTPEEFLGTLCIARGMLAANSGVPDYQRAARMIVKDYSSGKLLYCHPPPSVSDIGVFQEQTIQTALHNTRKLQEKLALRQQQQDKIKQQQQQQQKISKSNNNTISVSQNITNATKAGDDDSNLLLDNDILEMLGGVSVTDNMVKRGQKGMNKNNNNNVDSFDKFGKKNKTPKSKWGKKNRKNRNDDPYGCHSTPDDTILLSNSSVSTMPTTSSSTGLIIQGGKRYTTSGYTRPTSYPIL